MTVANKMIMLVTKMMRVSKMTTRGPRTKIKRQEDNPKMTQSTIRMPDIMLRNYIKNR